MADDAESSAEDEREVELSAIAAIFPELRIDPSDGYAASIDVAVSPTEPLTVNFSSLPDATISTKFPTLPSSDSELKLGVVSQLSEQPPSSECQVHSLSHLPPLSLRVQLPEGYPAEKAPDFTISTTPPWIPAEVTERLVAEGQTLWAELGKDQVVFSFIDHLQQAAERAFDISGPGATGPVSLPQGLQAPLLDFDLTAKKAKFAEETFECGICLDPKKGSVCHRLNLCSHVFCVQCLQDFYNNCIAEGDVHSVKCLDPDCGKSETPPDLPLKRRQKQDRRLSPSELMEIDLEPDMIKRYVTLKRKAEVEADKNTVYCPRKWCQGVSRYQLPPKGDESDDEEVAKVWKNGDPEDEMPPPGERVAICEDCSYAFCRVCLSGWHGELQRCWPRSKAELTAEEKASQDYMNKYSSCCPTCNARCQKTMGCNHMICFNCRTHFCYLCSAWLEQADPYKHFNQPWRACFLRLWDLEEGDGVDVPPFDLMAHLEEEDSDDGDENVEAMAAIVPPPQPAAEPQNQPAAHAGPLPPAPAAPAVPRAVPAPPAHQGGNGNPNLDNMGHRRREGQARGIRRFLEMAQNDEEDDWDSDEFDDDEDPHQNWEIPVR